MRAFQCLFFEGRAGTRPLQGLGSSPGDGSGAINSPISQPPFAPMFSGAEKNSFLVSCHGDRQVLHAPSSQKHLLHNMSLPANVLHQQAPGKTCPLTPTYFLWTGRNSASQTGGSEGKLQVGPSLCQGRHPKDGPRRLPASLLFVQHNQPWAKRNGEGQSQADIILFMEEKHQTLHRLLETSYTNVFVTLLPRDSMPETGPI